MKIRLVPRPSRTHLIRAVARASFAAALATALGSSRAAAQILEQSIPGPDRKTIFVEDTQQFAKQRSKEVTKITRAGQDVGSDLDIKAPQTEFLKEKNVVIAKDGVLLSQQGMETQADEAVVDLNTKDADLTGHVVLTTPDFSMRSQDAKMNIDSETGTFNMADFLVEQGNYGAEAAQVEKLNDTEFELLSSVMSTCHCDDGSKPWKISSSRCHLTRDSYAHSYNSVVSFQGVPLMYSPYLPFPTKEERQTGLLVPSYGYGNQDGLLIDLPFFVVLNDNADLTLTPFIRTLSRRGASLGGRAVFSSYHNVEGKFLYSDESRRGSSLRGTITDGLFDPTIDTNRTALFYSQTWRPEPTDLLPATFLADIHYVSDDLLLREIQDDDFGAYNSQFTSSTVALRSPLGDYATADISAEYNQSMISDDDLTFQRLPEITLNGSQNFRPFGLNPLGAKIVTSATVTGTSFSRLEGYDGNRLHIQPKVQVPFHVKNFVNATVEGGLYQTYYDLDNNVIPQAPSADPAAPPPPELTYKESSSRTLPYASISLGSGVERVYDVDPDGFLESLTSIGAENQPLRLERVKHTIEPVFKFTYIPETSQEQNALFDPVDRIRERSLFTYGFKTRLLGRMLEPQGNEVPITELTPTIDDLPVIDLDPALDDIDRSFAPAVRAPGLQRKGQIQQLANLYVRQSYDWKIAQENTDPNIHPYSDVGTDLVLTPNSYFGAGLGGNYSIYDHNFSSWGVALSARDDRGDMFRTRYSYVGSQLSQIEGNLELKLTERVRTGLYARYDELEREIIEDRMVIRLISECKCWSFDIGYSQRINPNREQVLFTFTLAGLGNLTQNLFLPQPDQTQNLP